MSSTENYKEWIVENTRWIKYYWKEYVIYEIMNRDYKQPSRSWREFFNDFNLQTTFPTIKNTTPMSVNTSGAEPTANMGYYRDHHHHHGSDGFLRSISEPGKLLSIFQAVFSRIYLNINYYQTNYLLIYSLALIIFLLQNPWSLIEITALVIGWTLATTSAPTTSLIIFQDRRITRNEKVAFMSICSIVLPMLTGILWRLFKYFVVATIIVLIHGVWRQNHLRYRPGDIHAELSDKW